MDFRLLKEFDNHQMLIGISDEASGLRGYIAIHNTNRGPALGGTRLQAYPSVKVAIQDALNLSKAMTYKCALANLPWGGGKTVILSEKKMNRDAVLKSYAKLVESLNGLFKTGTDVGVFDSDVLNMAKYTNHMLGVSPGDRGDMSTSKIAALGVYYSIKTALENVYGSEDINKKKIGIKGTGKLGGELVGLLYKEGADLYVADIDSRKTNVLKKMYPNINVVNAKTIHKLSLDIYSPCALGREFSSHNIGELNTKIIAGGANNQLEDDELGEKLNKRKILYAPDFIANAGGLIYVADELEADGFRPERVLKRVKGIRQTLEEVFTISKSKDLSTNQIANEIGRVRIEHANI